MAQSELTLFTMMADFMKLRPVEQLEYIKQLKDNNLDRLADLLQRLAETKSPASAPTLTEHAAFNAYHDN